MADNEHSPIGFSVEVEGTDELEDSLNKSEKAYLDFSKAITKAVKALMLESHEARETAKDKRHDAKEFDKEVKKETAWNKLRNFFTKQRSIGDKESAKDRLSVSERLKNAWTKEKDAADSAGFSIGALTAAIGGGSIIGILVGSTNAFLDWSNSLGELRTTASSVPGIMDYTGESIRDLSAELGTSRHELISMTKHLLDINTAGKKMSVTSEEFVRLQTNVAEFASAMDVSTEAVGGFYDSFSRVLKLPANRIRGMSASMKYLQEETSLTGQEVLSFAEGMKELNSRIIGSPEKRADAIRDFTAIGAVLKDQGVDATKFPSLFEEALKIDSEQGRSWLAFMESQTGVAMDSIRGMIEKGDMVTPMELFVKSTKNMTPEAIKQMEPWFDQMGLAVPELLRLREVNEDTLRDMVIKAKAADGKQAHIHDAAMSRQNELTRSFNAIKKVGEDIWLAIGEAVTKGLVKHLKWFTSPEGKEATQKWIQKASDLAKSLVETMFEVVDVIKSVIKWWGGLSDTTKSFIEYGAIALVALKGFSMVLGTVGLSLGSVISGGTSLVSMFIKLGPTIAGSLGPITAVAAGLVATYMAAKALADYVDSKQTESLKKAGDIDATVTEINFANGEKGEGRGKMNRSHQADVGAIKAIMGHAGSEGKLLTSTGEVNMGELNKRLSSVDADQRDSVRANWLSELNKVRASSAFEEAMNKRKDEDAKLAAMQGVSGAAASNTISNSVSTALPSAPIATPQVSGSTTSPTVIVKDSGRTDSILEKIYSLWDDHLSKQGTGARPTHPSRDALRAALGG